MTKKDFIKEMNRYLSKLSIDKQVELLNKISTEWIPELLQKKLMNYTKCSKCQKYAFTKRFKEKTVRERRHELIYCDAGYGDDDRYGEVEYLVIYSVCPLCGNAIEKKKIYIRTL